MKRLHLIEIHDQDWCPRTVRDAETDCLQFTITACKLYAGMVPVLAAVLDRTRTREVLDLCSGATGPWLWLHPLLAGRGVPVSVCLTDKYPHPEALGRAGGPPPEGIRYHPEPVDAMRVPGGLRGFRTMFTAFHHFRPEQARAVLADAVAQRQGIAVFEATQRSVAMVLLMLLVPLLVVGMVPFIRPFRWSRLFWTYVIPLVPLVTMFDGVVSALRAYRVEELRELAAAVGARDYAWDIGTVKGEGAAVAITYLIGVPQELASGGETGLGS